MVNLFQKYFVQINFNKNDSNKWRRFVCLLEEKEN